MRLHRKNKLSGLKYAQEGVLHCFRTQPHMRYHFYTLVAVLLSGLLLNLESRDMLVLVFAITLVIVAEMFNTAIEAIVDLVTENYNPIAKIAKDVAAGAVMLAAMNAIIAGVLIFFGQKKLEMIQVRMQQNLTDDLTRFIVVGVVLLTMVVIISKLLSDTGTPWHGGIVSGHSAVGFFIAMTIFFMARNTMVAILAILLAVLVAQSRVEAGVHSLREVVLGAVLAILLTSLVYWAMPVARGLIGGRPGSRAEVPVFPVKSRYAQSDGARRIEGVSSLEYPQTKPTAFCLFAAHTF